MNVKEYKLESHGDERGQLVAIENMINVPFEIKRVYYMWNTKPDVPRGFHAHKKLEQILVCIHGSCKLRLSDGKDIRVINLDKPDKAVYLSNDVWREMYDFTEGAVLMVVASELYDENDYIRDYNEFLTYVNDKNK